MTEVNGIKFKLKQGGPLKCPFEPNHPEKSPHKHEQWQPPKLRILDTVLDAIGNTPLVRLNRIPQSFGLECEVVAKCEFFNAGGSVKDRIGRRMVLDAEKDGTIKKGDILIEPTSGNTGIGLALSAAVQGYEMIITMPEKMSKEKEYVLKALGAKIIRTPTEADTFSEGSHVFVAEKLERELPNAHVLNQYDNPGNPLAHYDTTAEEIIQACDGKLDMIVVGAGTGGTITGIARKIKERIPNCKVVGFDPYGSILAEPKELNETDVQGYEVEGIGYDFIPTVCDRKYVDKWYKCVDKPSFVMARRLIREEGLLCGGSSGAAVAIAMIAAKELKKGQRCAVVLPDSIRNYMTKHLDDNWMRRKGFYEAEDAESEEMAWKKSTVADLKLNPAITLKDSSTVKNALDLFTEKGIDQLPVISTDSSACLGVVTMGALHEKLLVRRNADMESTVESLLSKQFKKVFKTTTLGQLSDLLEEVPFAVVLDDSNKVESVVTKVDLLVYTMNQNK